MVYTKIFGPKREIHKLNSVKHLNTATLVAMWNVFFDKLYQAIQFICVENCLVDKKRKKMTTYSQYDDVW